MSINESRSIPAAEDWGVVLQSVPSKSKREIVKRLEEIFELEKRDAEQILANTPLILVDNLSFGLAVRVKKFFQTIGAVAETTNHDMIKKNCFQVIWPQTPDLSFFIKNETGLAEASGPAKKSNPPSVEISPAEQKGATPEMKPEIPKIHEIPLPAKSVQESPPMVPHQPPVSLKPVQESPTIVTRITPFPEKPVQESPPVVPHQPPVSLKPVQESPTIVTRITPFPEKPVQESPKGVFHPHPVPEEKPAVASSPGAELEWEQRVKELNEKFQKMHAEKQALHAQHEETTEKVKREFQQRIEEEKQKSGEISKKACEDLQKEAQKHETLTREGEEWRSKALILEEKVRELEANVMQKTSASEHLIRQKDDLARQSEKIELEAQHELATLRSREQEFLRKIAGLERNIQEMTESLRSRDDALAQSKKQILEHVEKAQGFESVRQEHGQLARERATIQQEHDAKLTEREERLAKAEEDHRRYRSHADRKNAAATRELSKWIHGIDAIRQGLQKLILFLGSDSAVLDSEKKSPLRSPLTRKSDTPSPEKD